MPMAETSPAARPRPMLRLVMYSTAGPGTKSRSIAPVMNRIKDEGAMSIRRGSPVWLVAAATATAAAASAAGEASRRRGRAGAVPGCREDGKLDRGFLAGALGAGDFLLLVDDDLLEVFLAVFADVFVDGHRDPRLLSSHQL